MTGNVTISCSGRGVGRWVSIIRKRRCRYYQNFAAHLDQPAVEPPSGEVLSAPQKNRDRPYSSDPRVIPPRSAVASQFMDEPLDCFLDDDGDPAAPEEEPFKGLRGTTSVDGYTGRGVHDARDEEGAKHLPDIEGRVELAD